MTDPDRLLLIGRVGKPHGVRGEVKVRPETDDPERYVDLERVWVGASPETATERVLDGVRFQYPKGRTVILLGFQGIDTVEDVEAFRGLDVYALQDELPALEDGEVYVHDLIGLAVWDVDDADQARDEIGTVRDVYEGAQLLYAIQRPDGSEVLLPDVEAFVAEIDLEGKRLLIRPPEGLWEA